MNDFDYVRPTTIAEAVAAASEPGAAYLAAGHAEPLSCPPIPQTRKAPFTWHQLEDPALWALDRTRVTS